MNYTEKLKHRTESANSMLCVGLDPSGIARNSVAAWNVDIISQTHRYVCAFKLNLAFYEGRNGLDNLEKTLEYLQTEHPDIPIIGDAKRGDIDSTSEFHVRYLFDYLGFDAITLNPYLGYDSLLPFIDREDRGSIIVCRTSNPDADEFQMLSTEGAPLWERVIETVSNKWNIHGNCSAVIGGTRPDDIRRAREIAGNDMMFLVPGVGIQGGSIKDVMEADVSSNLIVSISRSIVNSPYPSRSAAEAQRQIRGS